MNRLTTEEWIDSSKHVVPASGQPVIEKQLGEDSKRSTKTVSRWQRPGPVFHIPEIHRSAKMGFLEKVAVRPKQNSMKNQKALSLLQLLIELTITLLIAGIVAPSLLRSGAATSKALTAGSLHAINIAGVTFLYT